MAKVKNIADDNTDNININITTCKTHDKFLRSMLSNLYENQTLLPNNVYIWLSREEYPVIPERLSSLKKEFDNLYIKYVKFNTYCHKSWDIFKYDNSSYNLMMDDNILYPSTYIEEMYNAAKIHNHNVICYFAKEMELSDSISYTENFSQNNKKNMLFSGMCCFPPNIFPVNSFKLKILRDTYAFKCDESWITTLLLKKDINIYGLHKYTSLNDWKIKDDNSQELLDDEYMRTNDLSYKFLSYSNCVYALNAVEAFKKNWPLYDPTKHFDLGGISICITAYKAKNFIKETLDSIISQTYFKLNNNWEIIIGIDGCEETLEYVKSIMHNYKNTKVYMMDSNRGTYITTNTIMKLAKFDKLFRFDADDIMLPDCVEKIVNTFKTDPDLEVCMLRFDNLKTNKKIRRICNTNIGRGQHVITNKVFRKFNGYRDWTCAGDTEFLTRIRKFTKNYVLNDVVYLLRWSENSLTADSTTGTKSTLRENYHTFIKNHKYHNECEAKLEHCVTNSYKKIINSAIVDKDEYIMSLQKSNIDFTSLKKDHAVKIIRCPFISPQTSNAKTITLGTYNPFAKSLKN